MSVIFQQSFDFFRGSQTNENRTKSYKKQLFPFLETEYEDLKRRSQQCPGASKVEITDLCGCYLGSYNKSFVYSIGKRFNFEVIFLFLELETLKRKSSVF